MGKWSGTNTAFRKSQMYLFANSTFRNLYDPSFNSVSNELYGKPE